MRLASDELSNAVKIPLTNSPLIGQCCHLTCLWLVSCQFTDDSSWPHNTHRDHHHIPGWENTTKHDNGASQNSFMQRGFSRCWDLLSSVTTRLLWSEILSTGHHLTMGPSIVPPGLCELSWTIMTWTWSWMGLRGQHRLHVLDLALFSLAANFSLGPGISSNISNNLWWWNILQWGSDDDGDPVLGDTGDISHLSCR